MSLNVFKCGNACWGDSEGVGVCEEVCAGVPVREDNPVDEDDFVRERVLLLRDFCTRGCLWECGPVRVIL